MRPSLPAATAQFFPGFPEDLVVRTGVYERTVQLLNQTRGLPFLDYEGKIEIAR